MFDRTSGTLHGLAAVFVVLAVGCSGDEPVAAPTSGSPTSAPTSASASASDERTQESSNLGSYETPTTEQPSAEQAAVLDAYQGYWNAILEANDPPSEQHPALGRFATGEAFESVFEAAQTNRLAGRALRLPADSISEHRAEVTSIDGDTAAVRDCAIDDGLVVDVESGDVVNDEVVTRLATGTLQRVDGQWKVATTRVEESWQGVAGCALGG